MAKAMLVAAGIAEPFASAGLPRATKRKMQAGTSMPAAAAITGRRRRSQVERRPSTNSLLISRPTSRKKIAIRPSLIHKWSDIGPSLLERVGQMGAYSKIGRASCRERVVQEV